MLIVMICLVALRSRQSSLASHEHYRIVQHDTDASSVTDTDKKLQLAHKLRLIPSRQKILFQ